MIPEPQNIFQLLAQSAQNNNGRTLQPTQVQEIVAVLQAMQYELAEMQVRSEALTRFSVVLIDHLGGDVVIDAEDYVNAETRGLEADWSEEGDEIALGTYEVDLPDVRPRDDADDDGELASVSPLPDEGDAEESVAGEAADADPSADEETA